MDIETNYPGKIRVNLDICTYSEITARTSIWYYYHRGGLVFDVQSDGEGRYIPTFSSGELAQG